MIKIPRFSEIPRGMVNWVRGVEGAIRELQRSVVTLTQQLSTMAGNPRPFQLTSPTQMFQEGKLKARITAEQDYFAIETVWASVPALWIDNIGNFDPVTGASVKQSLVTIGGTDILIQPIASLRIGYLPMAGGSANLYRDPSTGIVSFTASSQRYKQDGAEVDEEAMLRVLAGFKARMFRMIDEVERLGDDAPFYVGAFAEELAEIEGAEPFIDFIARDGDRLPESIRYSTLVVPLMVGYRRLLDDNEALKSENVDLTARVEALESRMENLNADH